MNKCDENADCTDTDTSYTCECKSGYKGDGFTCWKPQSYNDGDSPLDGTTIPDPFSPDGGEAGPFYNRKYVIIHSHKISFQSAIQICRGMGRQLAFPKSRKEVDEIFNDERMTDCGEKTKCDERSTFYKEKPYNDAVIINLYKKLPEGHDNIIKLQDMHMSSYGYAPAKFKIINVC